MSAEVDSLQMLLLLQAEFPKTTDCKQLDLQINLLLIRYSDLSKRFQVQAAKVAGSFLQQKKAEYAKLKCTQALSVVKAAQINEIVEQYAGDDKARIEGESKRQRNSRVILGAIILVTAFGILIYKKSKTA